MQTIASCFFATFLSRSHWGRYAMLRTATYTEMIWINLCDAPGGPLVLIKNSLDYRINIVALFAYLIMGWCMQVLLVSGWIVRYMSWCKPDA
ncbi:hypothetical protein EDD22DRAFT_876532 [Suillus occidentalis]|nr:hypothetical protein EDD22DRAFT_876532 [Suillus occidentalis]